MAERSPSERLGEHSARRRTRRLLVILGDQLDLESPVLSNLDRERDGVLMMEVAEEAEHVPSHRQRTTLFLAAMRHFGLELLDGGYRVRYVRLDDRDNTGCFLGEVERAVLTLRPERVLVLRPGEHRVQRQIEAACRSCNVELDLLEDSSFTCTLAEFEDWAEGREHLTLEYFYRERRRTLGVLVDHDGKPVGGRWNFDQDNREAFSSPPEPPRAYRARPDAVTREVMNLVSANWPEAPGRMDSFPWPVTRQQAQRALRRFIDQRLPRFGRFQDAMWTGEPFLYHSLLSSSLNLKLIRPVECVAAAVSAFESGKAPLASVEGFVRQIIGWREFIRGVYHLQGSDYPYRNRLGHHGTLPRFFWTGDTEMACLRHALGSVIEHAYGHHIERLMVIGNFALISGVHPREIHEWFLAMYVDAVEWVTAPNVIGMSQYADGGVVGSKPYAASGRYIDRMSNYCSGCRFEPGTRIGDDACPFTTLYWDFLLRHRDRFASNHRMAIMLRNTDRIGQTERHQIQKRSERLREDFGIRGIA